MKSNILAGFRTLEVHAGSIPDPVTGAILPPIYQSTTFVQDSVEQYLAKGYSYSRTANPTVVVLENRITALEGGMGTACFTTGMAATSALMMTFLSSGDHVVISDVVYGGTHRLSTQVLNRFGVAFTFVDTADPSRVAAAVRDNTRLIFTETPANPTLKLTDIAAISAIAKQHNIIHAVDNTFLTPCYQRPLTLGADLVVHSTTKYMDGHNATVGGCVVAADQAHLEAIGFVRNCLGSNMSAQVAFYTLQGIKTMSTRLAVQSASAMAIAQFLEGHPVVATVRYPGLASFPQYELACSQASGFGAMLWFDVKGGIESGRRLMNTLKLWSLAENLGAVESLVTHPATMTHADIAPQERQLVGITDSLVRLSTGLEDTDDLIADLKQALDRLL